MLRRSPKATLLMPKRPFSQTRPFSGHLSPAEAMPEDPSPFIGKTDTISPGMALNRTVSPAEIA